MAERLWWVKVSMTERLIHPTKHLKWVEEEISEVIHSTKLKDEGITTKCVTTRLISHSPPIVLSAVTEFGGCYTSFSRLLLRWHCRLE